MGEIAKRLEKGRWLARYKDLRAFWRALNELETYEVSYQSVVNYQGFGKRREPPVRYLVRAADVLGVQLEWLITGEGPMIREQRPADFVVPEPLSSSEFDALFEEARKSDKELASRMLMNYFFKETPFMGELSLTSTSLLHELCERLFYRQRAGPPLDRESFAHFGHDLGRMLVFPYARLGFDEEPGSGAFTDYVLALSQALLRVMPPHDRRKPVRAYPIEAAEARLGLSSMSSWEW